MGIGEWTKKFENFVQAPISEYEYLLHYPLPQTTSQHKVHLLSFDSGLVSVTTKSYRCAHTLRDTHTHTHTNHTYTNTHIYTQMQTHRHIDTYTQSRNLRAAVKIVKHTRCVKFHVQ